MSARRLVMAWLGLMALGAAELAASFLPLPHAWRPLIIAPGVLMILIVAVTFMEVTEGPTIVRAFALAALFWLFILLALGAADPLTRTDYPTPQARVAPPAGA